MKSELFQTLNIWSSFLSQGSQILGQHVGDSVASKSGGGGWKGRLFLLGFGSIRSYPGLPGQARSKSFRSQLSSGEQGIHFLPFCQMRVGRLQPSCMASSRLHGQAAASGYLLFVPASAEAKHLSYGTGQPGGLFYVMSGKEAALRCFSPGP